MNDLIEKTRQWFHDKVIIDHDPNAKEMTPPLTGGVETGKES